MLISNPQIVQYCFRNTKVQKQTQAKDRLTIERRNWLNTNNFFSGGIDNGDTILLDGFSPFSIDEQKMFWYWDCHISSLQNSGVKSSESTFSLTFQFVSACLDVTNETDF